MNLEQFPTSKSAQKMLESVDSGGFYDNSYVGKWIFQVMGLELDEARTIIEELPYQAFPETATWGLRYHEQKYGLPVREGMPYEERRRAIYSKRDERVPMNPYRMEVILENITGRKAHVDDESGPVNTFTVELEAGGNMVDVAAAIKKLKEIKQSHVSFALRFTSVAYIEICGKVQRYKARYTDCGTVPMVSTGLRMTDAGVEVAPVLSAYKKTVPYAGDQQKAGQYPKTSMGLKSTGANVEVSAEMEEYSVEYPETGDEVKAGTIPQTQYQAVYIGAEVETEALGDGYKYQNKVAGTAPVVSVRLAQTGAETEVEATGEGLKVAYALSGERKAGSAPKTSSGLEEVGEAVVPEVSTEYYCTRYKLCGNTFEIE